ncbi:hypothetical protein [Streptomyces hokutonensis]|uniref:hypothetical protein n=1 Tax=Streptomyces hokutonensis TaxID=1306990 RepID=UPI00037930A6|nr:hypothetical protein [Streptomyces hokutonensis]
MRRITLWLTATLAAAALLLAFQLNASGATGKSGDGGDHMPPAANATATASASASAKPGDDTPGDGDHAGKPGENK